MHERPEVSKLQYLDWGRIGFIQRRFRSSDDPDHCRESCPLFAKRNVSAAMLHELTFISQNPRGVKNIDTIVVVQRSQLSSAPRCLLPFWSRSEVPIPTLNTLPGARSHLGHVVVGACLEPLHDIALLRLGTDHDHGKSAGRKHLPHFAAHLQPERGGN